MIGFSPVAAEAVADDSRAGAVGTAYTLALDHGVFSATLEAANFNKVLSVQSASGLFNLTGQTALNAISEVAADVSYSLSAHDVYFGIRFLSEQSVFELTGVDALKGISENADGSQYALSGQSVTFKINISVVVPVESFTFSGHDVNVAFVNNRSEFAGVLTTAVTTAGNQVELLDETLNSATVEEPNTTDITVTTPNTVTLSSELNEAA